MQTLVVTIHVKEEKGKSTDKGRHCILGNCGHRSLEKAREAHRSEGQEREVGKCCWKLSAESSGCVSTERNYFLSFNWWWEEVTAEMWFFECNNILSLNHVLIIYKLLHPALHKE